MKNKFNIGYFLFTLGLIILLITFCHKCQSQTFTFNYRESQKGSYIININEDSIIVTESFVETENGYKKLWKNRWHENIQSQEYFQDRIEIQTESALYILFFCEDDTQASQVCEMQYYPLIGESLTYLKLLK